MSDLVTKAINFATRAHAEVEQVRKYTGDPYIVHPKAVAELVSTVEHDDEMLAAAWLHDTVEDTNVTPEDILHEFGQDVHDLVLMLTDITKLYSIKGNRKYRKTIDCAHVSMASPRAKTIKLADLIHNSESIFEHDEDFAKVFLREKEDMLKVLTEGNHELYQKALDIVKQKRK